MNALPKYSITNRIREVDDEWFPADSIPALIKHFKKEKCCNCKKDYIDDKLDITFVVTTHRVLWWHSRHGQQSKKHGVYA